ncbi:MAG TPA: phosphoglycolate phosphatase [Steroidobacteraceae bacterium]|nr:phosphoglycolate phosphatase [Steroidobacteraceae bacterium]
MKRSVRGVLLDLDGTLLDTAPDMAAALNRLRAENGANALAFEIIRPHVSHGAVALVRLAFPDVPEQEFQRLRERFLEVYAADIASATTVFAGFGAVLDALEACRLPWGVVTNKQTSLTRPLLAQMRLADRAACVVCGDTVAQRKPHPAPLLHAAALLGLEPHECVYVGDAERDVQAGRAAGMHTLIALFGYLGAQDRPERWQADGLLREPSELLGWLDGADGATPKQA